MRKFTLLLAASAFALSSMAQVMPSSKAAEYCKAMGMGGEKLIVGGSFKVTPDANPVLSPKTYAAQKLDPTQLRKAPERVTPLGGTVEAAYMNSYISTPYDEGYIYNSTMKSIPYVVDGNDIYVRFYSEYSDVEYIKGTIGDELEVGSGMYLVTFADGQTVTTLTSGTNVCIYNCALTATSEAGVYDISPAGSDIYAIYIPAYDEIYFPGAIGLFVDADTPVMTDYYIIQPDIMSVKGYAEYMRVAEVTATDSKGNAISGDAVAIFYGYADEDGNEYYGYYVGRGAIGFDDWIAVDLFDDTSAGIYSGQWMNRYYWSTNSTDYTPGDLVAMIINSGWTNYIQYMSLSVSTDIDGNTTLTDENGDYIVGDILFEDPEEGGYAFIHKDYKLLITNEQASAIEGVKDNGKNTVATEYYDLSGRKVGSDAKGLVIEKVRYADGKTVSRKVVK